MDFIYKVNVFTQGSKDDQKDSISILDEFQNLLIKLTVKARA